jgi:hypothetical protein
MIEPICHMAMWMICRAAGAAQSDLMLALAIYVHHETEWLRDGSVAFPP